MDSYEHALSSQDAPEWSPWDQSVWAGTGTWAEYTTRVPLPQNTVTHTSPSVTTRNRRPRHHRSEPVHIPIMLPPDRRTPASPPAAVELASLASPDVIDGNAEACNVGHLIGPRNQSTRKYHEV